MVPRKSVKTVANKNITTPNRKKVHVAKNTKALRDELVKTTTGRSSIASLTAPPMQVDEDPDLEEPIVTIAENLTPSKKKNATGEPLKIIYLDIFKLNNDKFEGEVTKLEAKAIWRALKQNTTNINRINSETVQGNFVRLGYDLLEPVKLTELSNRQDFTIEVNRGLKSDLYKVRLADYQTLACSVGDTVKVAIYHTGLEVKAEDIKVKTIKIKISTCGSVRVCKKLELQTHTTETPYEFRCDKAINRKLNAPCEFVFCQLKTVSFKLQKWVENFGKVTSEIKTPKTDDEIGSDEWVFDFLLEQHIPQVLPIDGNRAIVYYPGIPKQCKKCYENGHTAPTCQNQPVDWLDYVARFLKTGNFTERMLGRWMDALRKYHPEHNRNPEDLRQHIVLNKRGVPRGDLRRQIGPSTSRDLRTNIGSNAGSNPNQQAWNQNQVQYVGNNPQRGRGWNRGRGRGQRRGRGRGRGQPGRGRGYHHNQYQDYHYDYQSYH